MSTEESPPGQETGDLRKAGVPCPYCKYGILAQSLKGNHLVCDGCHRKVHQIQMTVPRLRLLLDAFDKLSSHCYDKELNRYADYAGSETSAELEAREFAWTSNDDAPGPDHIPDLAIPSGWLKISKLSETALSALNQLRQDYEFDEGPGYLEDMLDVLRHLTKRTASQGRLRRQLEAIPYSVRESLSRLLVTGHPLEGVKLKLNRAEKHLDDLIGILSLIKVGECCITPERDENLGLLVQKISIEPKPPLELSVLIGDFLFCARSALDHLIWQLVIHNGGTPTSRNMFPIASSLSRFNQAVAERGRLEGVSPETCSIIESLQPYHSGNEALGQLDTLHNADKHRSLNLTTVVADNTELLFSLGGDPVLRMLIGDEELRDGAVFGGIGIPFNDAEFTKEFPEAVRRISETEVRGQASLFVAFNEPEGEVGSLEDLRVDSTLQNILKVVRGKVILTIEPLFR